MEREALRAKVGAYYFDGWTGRTGHITERLVTEFEDREPVWGWRDDSPAIMRQQIDYAADNALAFFAFDWYYPESESKETPLNVGLDLYLQAENKERIEFCLLVANHAGFRIGPEDWDAVSDIWIRLFKEPTHLKVGGEPLLIIFSPSELDQAFEGVDGVRLAFTRLREKARAEGIGGVATAACCLPGPENGWSNLDELAASGYTFFTGYNYHGYPLKGGVKIQAYASLVEGHEEIWGRFAAKAKRPYIPVVTCGWDMRPWEDPDKTERQSVYYPDSTPRQLGNFMERAIRWLDANPEQTSSERLILLYAWNENGEGGYLTPTKSRGDAYLKAVANTIRGT